MYPKVIKPFFDFFAALIGLIIASPVFIVILIILMIEHNGKPFFKQSRPGKNERVFKIIKFKTMNEKKDEHGEFLPFHMRITKFGWFIRKYSLDEIPQLINIIKGDMSLVGPRPLHIEYLPLYNETQARRHEVMSGITGWAQVNGRNAISWEQKFEYDVWYVDNQSFLLDLKIILMTIEKVLTRKDVNASENDNMPAFKNVKVQVKK
ncbi:MAG: sugar transferase [Flavobacteriaceae bacterium]|nr:sugar transferase [Bacteroidia bacterium]MBT8268807.1 sugar transferase [Bacteroidia bacterium]MBT8286472.1 sugar transferase [Bacteroidia bacterium]NNF75492.1 sugar transferase [Flavobacteriaceae bacterium]NNL79193.1 sugar transferase [Flavobacteriaceae bacterium]